MKSGFKNEAFAELGKIAYANSINNWSFYEWFNSKNGEPNGMKGQSWNAGMFIFAYHYLNKYIKF